MYNVQGKCLQILQHGNNIHMGKWNPSKYHRIYMYIYIRAWYNSYGSLAKSRGSRNDLSSFGDQEIIFMNTVATNHLKASGHMFESPKLLNIFFFGWCTIHWHLTHFYLWKKQAPSAISKNKWSTSFSLPPAGGFYLASLVINNPCFTRKRRQEPSRKPKCI